MLAIVLLAMAPAAETQAAPPPRSEARTVIEAQLASPPRIDGKGGVDRREAEAIRARAIEMIGKTISREGSLGSP